MQWLKIAAGFAVGLSIAAHAAAQDYPNKPVRVLIGFPPGGAIDITVRAVTQKLSDRWRQPVVVENRPGAGGSLGAAAVAKSPPDGYMLLAHSNAYVVNPALYAELPYDPKKDFVPIAPLASQAFVLVVGQSSDIRTVAALIAAAKARPGQLHYGSAGVGSGTHLIAEKFKLAAGIDTSHVPYKGGPEANADTIAGRISYWFPPTPVALPHIRSGKLVALALTSPRRSSLLTDVPTMTEAGVAGAEDRIWYGMWAPAGTPPVVVDKIAKDIARALAAPEMLEQFAKLGTEPMSMTPTEFAHFVGAEMESAARVVKAAGIRPQ